MGKGARERKRDKQDGERLGKKERKMEGREVKERKEEGKKGGPFWPGETAAATLDTYRVGTEEGLCGGEYTRRGHSREIIIVRIESFVRIR